MSERERVLFANDAFYNAFARGDLITMDSLWSRSVPVCCIHPGWPALRNRDSVMQSWESILGSGGAGSIRATVIDLLLHDRLGIVICQETIGSNVLVATNVYRFEQNQWLVCHHHAGAIRVGATTDDEPPPVTN